MEDQTVLLLYFKPSCPFCQKVLNFIEDGDLSIPLKDISKVSESRDELLHLGGKTQVPCLFIDGKALYESDDIIQWLKKHKEST